MVDIRQIPLSRAYARQLPSVCYRKRREPKGGKAAIKYLIRQPLTAAVPSVLTYVKKKGAYLFPQAPMSRCRLAEKPDMRRVIAPTHKQHCKHTRNNCRNINCSLALQAAALNNCVFYKQHYKHAYKERKHV